MEEEAGEEEEGAAFTGKEELGFRHAEFEASQGWPGRNVQWTDGFVGLTFGREVLKKIQEQSFTKRLSHGVDQLLKEVGKHNHNV